MCFLKGLALWPGLSPTVHSRAQVLSKSSSTKLPPWMMGTQATCTSKTVSLLSEPLRVQPRKLKKCASHIYICRLIKVLQTSKNSLTTLNQTEPSSSEMSERRLPDPVTTIISDDFKTMVSSSTRYQNPHLLDMLHRTHNPKPVQEDMTQLGLEHYGPPHTSQKQVIFNITVLILLTLCISDSNHSFLLMTELRFPNSLICWRNNTISFPTSKFISTVSYL